MTVFWFYYTLILLHGINTSVLFQLMKELVQFGAARPDPLSHMHSTLEAVEGKLSLKVKFSQTEKTLLDLCDESGKIVNVWGTMRTWTKPWLPKWTIEWSRTFKQRRLWTLAEARSVQIVRTRYPILFDVNQASGVLWEWAICGSWHYKIRISSMTVY